MSTSGTFVVPIRFKGTLSYTVRANSEEEAMSIANELMMAAEHGVLEDHIDWECRYPVDVEYDDE